MTNSVQLPSSPQNGPSCPPLRSVWRAIPCLSGGIRFFIRPKSLVAVGAAAGKQKFCRARTSWTSAKLTRRVVQAGGRDCWSPSTRLDHSDCWRAGREEFWRRRLDSGGLNRPQARNVSPTGSSGWKSSSLPTALVLLLTCVINKRRKERKKRATLHMLSVAAVMTQQLRRM